MGKVSTHKKVIAPQPIAPSGRHRILMPILMYVNATVFGAFSNLTLEVLKFTVGIFKAECRTETGLGVI